MGHPYCKYYFDGNSDSGSSITGGPTKDKSGKHGGCIFFYKVKIEATGYFKRIEYPVGCGHVSTKGTILMMVLNDKRRFASGIRIWLITSFGLPYRYCRLARAALGTKGFKASVTETIET
jgi:hypothetical protein